MEQVKGTNANVAQATAKPQANAHEAAKKAADAAAFKARKTEAAKAFAERQAQLKADRVAAINELKAFFTERKLEMPPKTKVWLEKETAVRTAGGKGSNFFNKVFGATPKVGDKVTLLDYMKLTLKAKADLDKYVKQWAEKGIVVEYKEDSANLLGSTYTIVKMA